MVKGKLTGAGYGFNSWLQQRITAVIMLVFAIAFIAFILFSAYSVNSLMLSWQSLFNYLPVKIGAQIFFLALIIHAWVGIRDIWMDYIKCSIIKLSLHLATILWLVGCLIYSIKVIW